MNLFQAANGAATFLILSALVAGLARHLDGVQGSLLEYLIAHVAIAYLGIFIVIFRIKTLLDDHRHFAEPYQDKSVFRYVGFVLAILSWLFWGLAAYLVPSTVRSSELMATSILISTLWVAVHVIEILVDPERRNKEVVTSIMREKWVLVNVGYMLCLVAHVGWFRPLIAPADSTPLLVLLGLLIFDVLTSRSFRDVINPASG
jgi:thiamine transporter ThiT